jgi:hypothetical protein
MSKRLHISIDWIIYGESSLSLNEIEKMIIASLEKDVCLPRGFIQVKAVLVSEEDQGNVISLCAARRQKRRK